MKDYQSLSHSKWNCKYHLIFIPKCRKKKIYCALRHHLGELFHGLAKQKEATIEEGHLHSDHVHMCISIPPKYAVANVVGFLTKVRVRFRLHGIWDANGISPVRVFGRGDTL